MCIYVYICIYVYMYICIYVFMYICIYVIICMYIYMNMCIYIYVYINIYEYVHVHVMYVHVYMYMYIISICLHAWTPFTSKDSEFCRDQPFKVSFNLESLPDAPYQGSSPGVPLRPQTWSKTVYARSMCIYIYIYLFIYFIHI